MVGRRFGDFRDVMRPIVGDAVVDRMPPIWGINKEGEIQGVWREIGTPGLWYMVGESLSLRLIRRIGALTAFVIQVTSHGRDSFRGLLRCVSPFNYLTPGY